MRRVVRGLCHIRHAWPPCCAQGRPPGLNTVELLKVASSALGIGPAQAMQVRLVAHVHTNHNLLTLSTTAHSVHMSGNGPSKQWIYMPVRVHGKFRRELEVVEWSAGRY